MSKTLKVFLKKVSLFSELSDAELELLAQVAVEVGIPAIVRSSARATRAAHS